jgi:hypothetical protein
MKHTREAWKRSGVRDALEKITVKVWTREDMKDHKGSMRWII